MGCKRKRGVKDDSQGFAWATLWIKLLLIEVGKIKSGATWLVSVYMCYITFLASGDGNGFNNILEKHLDLPSYDVFIWLW